MHRANDVSRAGYGATGSGVATGALAIAAVAALALVFGLLWSRGAQAEHSFDGRIVPVMVVSADYQARADVVDYRAGYAGYLDDVDSWFTWSTGGLALDRVEPQFLSVPYTNHQLWCSDLRVGASVTVTPCDASQNVLESNIDHLLTRELGVNLRPASIGSGSPAPWVAVWGAAGYAGEPMVGETAFYMWLNGGSCDGLLPSFPGDDVAAACAQNPRGSWVGAGLGSSVHELAHLAWDLSHPADVVTELARPAGSRAVPTDPSGQLMATPSDYPAVGWADYEIAAIEQLDARYIDLKDPVSPIAYVETSTYVTGTSRPLFPAVPTLQAARDGLIVTLDITTDIGAAPIPADTTYRVFSLDADTIAAGQHVPVVASTTATRLEVPFAHAGCFVVMAWSPAHRPSSPSHRWDACVDRYSGIVSATNRAPSLGYVPDQENQVGEAIVPVAVSARDRDGDAIEITMSNLPDGLSFDPASRSIVGVPAASGSHLVDVTAADGRGLSTTRQFDWTLSGPPTTVETPGDVIDDVPVDAVPVDAVPVADLDSGCGGSVQQASEASVSGVVRVGVDAVDDRTGYVSIDDGLGDLYRFEGAAVESSIRFCVDVASPGRYVIFGSTIAPDTTSDSFFVQIDGGDVFPWHIPQSTIWRRNVVRQPASGPLLLELDAGQHVVEFFHREDGVMLERFELTRV